MQCELDLSINISEGWEFKVKGSGLVEALGVGSMLVQDAGEKPAKMARLSES